MNLDGWTSSFKASLLSGAGSIWSNVICPLLMVLCFLCGLITFGTFIFKWRSGIEGGEMAMWVGLTIMAFVMGFFFASGGGWSTLIAAASGAVT